MADTEARRQIDAMVARFSRTTLPVLIHEVKGAEEHCFRLSATGISTGIAVAVTGIYRDPSPNPRASRFLLHAGEGTLDADMDKLEQELEVARAAGLLDLEAHVLVPEAYSFTRRARRPDEPEAASSSSSSQQQGEATSSSGANNNSSLDSLPVREWDEKALLETQKGLRERIDAMTRGGKVRWYKYPVCHQSGPHRYTHGMLVSHDEWVECGSIGRSGQGTEMEPRVINPVEEGKEDEDSGLRCC